MPGFRRRAGSRLAAWLTRTTVALQCMDLLKVLSDVVPGRLRCMKGSIGGRGVDDMRRAGSRSRTALIAPSYGRPSCTRVSASVRFQGTAVLWGCEAMGSRGGGARWRCAESYHVERRVIWTIFLSSIVFTGNAGNGCYKG